jgi:hypothetical protein
MKHDYQIQRVISEAKMRNTIQSEKVSKWKEDKKRLELEEMYRMYLSEEQYKKKMQKIAKSTQEMYEQIKQKKMMRIEK